MILFRSLLRRTNHVTCVSRLTVRVRQAPTASWVIQRWMPESKMQKRFSTNDSEINLLRKEVADIKEESLRREEEWRRREQEIIKLKEAWEKKEIEMNLLSEKFDDLVLGSFAHQARIFILRKIFPGRKTLPVTFLSEIVDDPEKVNMNKAEKRRWLRFNHLVKEKGFTVADLDGNIRTFIDNRNLVAHPGDSYDWDTFNRISSFPREIS